MSQPERNLLKVGRWPCTPTGTVSSSRRIEAAGDTRCSPELHTPASADNTPTKIQMATPHALATRAQNLLGQHG